MLLCCLLNLLFFWTLAIFAGSKAPRPFRARLKNAKKGVCPASWEHLYINKKWNDQIKIKYQLKRAKTQFRGNEN